MKLHFLLNIDGVSIMTNEDGTYVQFISDLDICNDGSGPAHGDPSYQGQTAYYNGGEYLNADKDKYVVVPPQIRSSVAPVVMGCQARVTRLNVPVARWSWGVVGDIGPKSKTGECAYVLAHCLNDKTSHNSGDSKRIYLYELWPGLPAIVDETMYELEPAS